MKIPNLFTEARGELAQDAVLAWIFSWAHPKYATVNAALHRAGTDLLRRLAPGLLGHQVPLNVSATCQTGRGGDRPDVIVQITTLDHRLALIVEHKVAAGFDSGQILRYAAAATALTGVAPDHVGLAFLKTGILFQADRRAVESLRPDMSGKVADLCIMERRELIAVLQPHVGAAGSDILRDYVGWLQQIDDHIARGLTVTPAAFSAPASWEWQALFDALADRLRSAAPTTGPGHGVVNPPTGAFAAMWFAWVPLPGQPYDAYVQVHATEGVGARVALRLCMRGFPADRKVPTEVLRTWSQRMVAASLATHWPMERPSRLAPGTSAAVAHRLGPWWVAQTDGRVDIEATAAKFAEIGAWLTAAVTSMSPEPPEHQSTPNTGGQHDP